MASPSHELCPQTFRHLWTTEGMSLWTLFPKQRCTMAGKVGVLSVNLSPGACSQRRENPPLYFARTRSANTSSPGQSQFLTTPALAKPLNFGNLSLNEDDDDDNDVTKAPKDSDTRLMEMLQAQAAANQAGHGLEDEQTIVNDTKLTEAEKKDLLQKAVTMAASNGDVAKVQRLLDGNAKSFVNVNAADEDGTPPLIYASCFVSRGLAPSLPVPTSLMRLSPAGTRKCCKGPHRCWRRRQQTRPEPMERPHVGHDESTQRHRKASLG